MTVDEFRARFPIFAHTVYVNSCSQGALSLDVRAAFDAFTTSWDTHGSPWERWVGEVERLRAVFATLIGAEPDEIAVMPSASAAIAAIATALSFDGERRQVLLSEFEFPTMAHVWLAQQRRGAIVDRVPAHGERLPIAHYRTRVDERTLIVPAAHVCFRNGYRLDVAALASLCKKRGAYLMLDDYQRTGTAPLDVHALGVDVLVTGALKYLLGPAGIAFLYVRRELIERFEPLSTGWFGRVNPFAFSLAPLDWAASARRFEAGTPPIPNVYAAAAGLDLLNALGPAAVDAQIRRLTARMIDGARRHGFAVATPDDPEQRGALVVVRSTDAGALVQRLAARGIVASARGTGLRVSFHAYNDDDDVDAVLAALDAEGALVDRQA